MMDHGVRRKDTTKGPPLRILSLDGGGVRGYSMLIILQELMHRIYVETEGKAPRRAEIPKPCDHFDLICGTGTGGLIAIMLGRLRLDLETCKEVYVRMTRKVFETDKTIAGIPYRSTLFKASKLEEAIKECVREHTFSDEEGNDDADAERIQTPISTRSGTPRRHASNASVVSFSARSPTSYMAPKALYGGDPNAKLYDARERRTKTAVTAYYKGSSKNVPPAMLRSYDSRREPAPEYECTIWEAGRATSAIGLAFKPIQVGQSVFIDEGQGQYNPAVAVLDEATINEWPGRDVGVFVSVGTGKRPASTDHSNHHLWYEGFMGEYAEARRRLISKIEGCEETHRFMLKEHLAKRGVNVDNYYRLNVEIGVGEFGMNEWNRLADVSTGTRRYLAKPDVQRQTLSAAAKMAKIHRARVRLGLEPGTYNHKQRLPDLPEPDPIAFELPAEDVVITAPPSRSSYESGQNEKLNIPHSHLSSPRTSDDHLSPNTDDRFLYHSPTPANYRNAAGTDLIAITSPDEYPHPRPHPDHLVSPPPPDAYHRPAIPPPLPPKTPIPGEPPASRRQMMPVAAALPYPVDDGPPPVANMASKPEYHR